MNLPHNEKAQPMDRAPNDRFSYLRRPLGRTVPELGMLRTSWRRARSNQKPSSFVLEDIGKGLEGGLTLYADFQSIKTSEDIRNAEHN